MSVHLSAPPNVPWSADTMPVSPTPSHGTRPRFLSEEDCHSIAQRLARFAEGGGITAVTIWSRWTGNVRWARNLISTSGDVRQNLVKVVRDLQGAENGWVLLNDTSDVALVAAARRAERLARLDPQIPEWDLVKLMKLEPDASAPSLFHEATYQLDPNHRAQAAIALAASAAAAGMLSAGYIEVSAHSLAMIDSLGRARYFPYTWASYSVTVRDPSGTGSGWAGVDWPDWSRVDSQKLSDVALDKCLKSRNPVAIEPGRYTTILEPQATCDFVGTLMSASIGQAWYLGRDCNEGNSCSPRHPFVQALNKQGQLGKSMLGQQVVDERITISSDPSDPELGFPPFLLGKPRLTGWMDIDVYHPATWIRHGILTQLPYDWEYGMDKLGLATGLPLEGAFRMSGGDTAVDEMISTTQRGLLVTRFDRVGGVDMTSVLVRGYTRDGLWLIEQGKISKPVKNMMFTESVLFALNNILQLGVPQRTYRPCTGELNLPQPAIVPPMKVKDFSFTALADAV